MKVTIEEIARRAGVSKSTVSNVLNNRKNKVGQDTWENVLRIAEEIGYVPRRNIRPHIERKTKRIAVVLSETSSEALHTGFLFPGLLSGLADACNNWKYQLVVTTLAESRSQDYFFEELAESAMVDGFVLPEIRKRDYRIKLLKDRDLHTVCVGKPEGSYRRSLHWVDVDVENLVEQLVEDLLEKGYHDIAYLGLSRSLAKTSQELRGYQAAMEKRGMTLRQERIAHCDRDVYRAKKVCQGLLRHRPRVILTGSETLAMGCYEAVQEQGMKIPDDVGIASVLESRMAQSLSPALAGIDRKSYELGLRAGDYLIKLSEGFTQDKVHVFLKSELSWAGSLP